MGHFRVRTPTLSALILMMGALSDRFGRKRLFLFGVAEFSLSSLSCGLARNATELILARGAQGIGGAAMFATALALIGQEFSGRERAGAIAAWGATVGGAVAIGPLVGGVLTSGLGWQWIFYVNVPIGFAIFVMASTRLRNVADPGATRLDIAGVVTFSAMLFLLVFALVKGRDDGWSSRTILTLLASSAALLVAFIAVELVQKRPMLDLSLFRYRSFVGVSMAKFCVSAGMFAMFPYLTFYLQNDPSATRCRVVSACCPPPSSRSCCRLRQSSAHLSGFPPARPSLPASRSARSGCSSSTGSRQGTDGRHSYQGCCSSGSESASATPRSHGSPSGW